MSRVSHSQRFFLFICIFFLGQSFFLKAQIRPEVQYPQLFKRVQMAGIFPDSKTFADCIPKYSVDEIVEQYHQSKHQSDFDLPRFVNTYFDLPPQPASGFKSNPNASVEGHIGSLWPILTRQADKSQGSLIPLPNPYVVPGGRFREIYYWDSYFTMLGLAASGKEELIAHMLNNFAYLIDTLGFIPNGNRTYFTGRSQPPFFSLMVKTLADIKGEKALLQYLPQMQKEYDFWMAGASDLQANKKTHRRVVWIDNTTILNRYWDDRAEPRPESYKEDVELQESSKREALQLYRDLRAACESGWDFSTRWLRDGQSLETIYTSEIIPVDLNCLLYHLEMMLARAYSLAQKDDQAAAFLEKAKNRKTAILKYCWNGNFFMDYDFVKKQTTDKYTLAGAFPLFFEIADKKQAKKAAKKIKSDFLQPGGLVTTLKKSGQQWDAPNGWAPLQWISIKGLKNYGQNSLAEQAAQNWIKLNRKVFKNTGKMVEKYNVMDINLEAGGGEYENQDGFGWTNGVFLKIVKDNK